MHHPPLRAVVVDGVVLGDAVVPEGHVVFLPAPADGEFRAGGVGEEKAQQGVAFGRFQFVDAVGETVVDEQALVPGNRVGTHHRVNHGRVGALHFVVMRQGFGRIAEALQREGAGEVVGGSEAVEQLLQRLRQGVIGGAAACPEGVAAVGRQVLGGEYRAEGRSLQKADVGVPDGIVAHVGHGGVEHEDFRLLCQVGLAVCCSLLTGRPTSAGMGEFNVKAREASR